MKKLFFRLFDVKHCEYGHMYFAKVQYRHDICPECALKDLGKEIKSLKETIGKLDVELSVKNDVIKRNDDMAKEYPLMIHKANELETKNKNLKDIIDNTVTTLKETHKFLGQAVIDIDISNL